MHVDLNEDENVLIYPYYQHTLLGLLQEDSNVADAARKKILQQTGEAIQELHSKDWIHIGMYDCQSKFDVPFKEIF
jgi:serine/threonine protein kinase